MGETYTFMSWNSDNLMCNFKQDNNVAKVRQTNLVIQIDK